MLSVAPVVTGVTLVRAKTAAVVSALSAGSTVDPAVSGPLSLMANISGSIGSVLFSIDGKRVQTENVAPYDIAGDNGGAPKAWTPPTGSHTLTVTPYSAANGKGTAGATVTILFNGPALVVVPPPVVPPVTPPVVPPMVPPPSFFAQATPAGSFALSGTLIGTPGSYQKKGNTITIAADGNAATFFDAATASGGAWVGLDLGAEMSVTQVQYLPRSGFGGRMVGGVFQGSDSPTFSTDVITLFTVTKTPATGGYTATPVVPNQPVRYVRYLSPKNSYGNIAEFEFDGYTAGQTPVVTDFPTSVAWATGTPSPVVRAEAVGGIVDGKVYVFGGLLNEGDVKTHIPLQSRSDVYDPSTDTWKRLADMPIPFSHSEEVVVGTDIWFVGGYVGDHPGPGTTSVFIYHTTTDTWDSGPNLPVARGAGAAALVGNMIYFSGGMDATRTIDEATTYALDVNNQSAGWVQLTDAPDPRNHVAAVSLGGEFYLLGGQHGQEDGQAAQSEVDRYDPTTYTWTVMAPLPFYAGKSHIAESAFAYDGRIIVVGGETGYDDPQAAIESYDPSTNAWSKLGSLPAVRSTAISGIIGNRLIVTTGNGPSATNTTWVGTLG